MSEENNKNDDSFIKKTGKKFGETVEKAEKMKKKVKFFMALPTPVKIAVIVIPITIVLIIAFSAGMGYLLGWFQYENMSQARSNSFTFSASAPVAASAPSTNVTTVLIQENENWKLNINNEIKENLRVALSEDDDTFKDKLEKNGINSNIDEMSQNEIILAILILNGLEPEDFTEEELNIIPMLLKAELSTRAVDLRETSQMYIDGEYQKQNFDTNSDIIPGTIHFKRVNSGANNGSEDETILQYVDYGTFKGFIGTNKNQSEYENAKKYFSINDEGKVVIITWSHIDVSYNYINGQGIIPDSEKRQNTSTYNLKEEVVNYEAYIDKYTMPFEVLAALLVSSEDCNFVKEVANLAFESNIEIAIFEEYNWDKAVYTTKYNETIRNYQYIEAFAQINGIIYTTIPEELIERETDDQEVMWAGQERYDGKKYTYKTENFTISSPTFTCEETIIREENTYKYGITKADTWWICLNKEYTVEIETPQDQSSTSQYNDIFTLYKDNVTDAETRYFEEYLESKKNTLVTNARTNIASSTNRDLPTVSIGRGGINISWNDGIKKVTYTDRDNNVKEENCNNATSYSVVVSQAPKEIVVIDSNEYSYNYEYNNSNGRYYEKEIEVDLGYNGRTEQYRKLDTTTSIVNQEKKYKIVDGTTNQKIYDSKNEKFLLAFDTNSKARGNIQSTPGWLEEYLDDYNPDFTTIIDYLFYAYKNGADSSRISDLSSTFNLEIFEKYTSINGLSAFGCSLQRDEFVALVKNYKTGDADYQNYIAKYAEDFYDTCTENDVNPVIAIAHSCLETGYGSSSRVKNQNNYFGMNVNNNAAAGSSYSTPKESIQDYCEWVIKNANQGTSAYVLNTEWANKYFTYNNKLSGMPDKNIYVLYCRYAQLISEETHTQFVKDFTKAYYGTECSHELGSTITEQEIADYAVYTTDLRVEIAENIFGEGILVSASSTAGMTEDGDGKTYQGHFTASTGETFTLYRQAGYNDSYWGGTIATHGCGPSSCAILLSGLLRFKL